MLDEVMQRLANNITDITYDETGINGNIFQDNMPAEPDIAIMVQGTGGFPRDMWLTDYFEPTMQIIVRGTRDPRVARSLVDEIIAEIGVLGEEKWITSGNWYVIKCQAIQPQGIYIGPDDNNRHRFSVNFEMEVKKL
jgi:hypothetical protein